MVDGVLYEVLKVSEIPLDYSSIAQLVEHAAVNRAVVGSSPTRGVFFNERIKIRLRGQAVKTSPFHGGNTGSIPVGVIYHSDNRSIVAKRMIKLCILFYYV